MRPQDFDGAALNSVFGTNAAGAAYILRSLTGLVFYLVGHFEITRPTQRALMTKMHWSVIAALYGVALWVFGLYGMAHIVAGLPAFLALRVFRWHLCPMEIRTHKTSEIASEAAFSKCGLYRYRLTRRWAKQGGLINFVMLNPSKANEFHNDPTVERCERRARQLGYGAFCVTNIFAWRDTDPKAMRQASEPNGPQNDDILIATAAASDRIIAAWGAHGEHLGRGPEVATMLRQAGFQLYHLGFSKHGHPRHPLYIPYERQPELWI